MSFGDRLYEALRDKARDRLCVDLRRLGIDARSAEAGREEEDTDHKAMVAPTWVPA